MRGWRGVGWLGFGALVLATSAACANRTVITNAIEDGGDLKDAGDSAGTAGDSALPPGDLVGGDAHAPTGDDASPPVGDLYSPGCGLCPPSTPYCSSSNTCVACLQDQQCNAPLPLCQDGVCVVCRLPVDCPTPQTCDTAVWRCVGGCNGDGDCPPALPRCAVATGICHACLTAADCKSNETCNAQWVCQKN